MICVSLSAPDPVACQLALEGLEFAEIRLDGMRITVDECHRLFSSPHKLIATCRPDGRSETERRDLLVAAVEAGARYVDLELEAPAELRAEILDLAGPKGCKVILSHHDHQRTPDRVRLEHLRDACFGAGADLAKIACAVSSASDCARLLGLLDCERDVLAIGMGPAGTITRLVGPLLGSPFTYASLSPGAETAPGQLDYRTLAGLLDGFRRG